MEIDHVSAFMSIPHVGYVAAAPSGEKIAFQWKDNEIYCKKLGEPPTKVTNGELTAGINADLLQWSADSRALFIRVGGEGGSDIHRYDLSGSHTSVISGSTGDFFPWDVTPDGRYLIYRIHSGKNIELWRHDLRNSDSMKITDNLLQWLGGGLSPDGEKIACVVTDGREEKLSIIDIEGTIIKKVSISGSDQRAYDWFPDSNRILLFGIGYYNLQNDSWGWFDVDEGRPVAVLNEDNVLIEHTNEYRTRLEVYDSKSSKEKQIPSKLNAKTSYDCPIPGQQEIILSGHVLFRRTNETHPRELYKYDMDNDITKPVVEFDHKKHGIEDFVTGKYVEYEGQTGRHGATIYEAGDHPSPVVVILYGDSDSEGIVTGFDRRIQLLCYLGYSVLVPGHGGDPFHENPDYAKAAQWLKSRDWVDNKRVVAFGYSHGGYDVAMQLGKYDVWDAGISWSGVFDLTTWDSGGRLERIHGSQEENRKQWKEHSPITYSENVSAPLLLMAGAENRTDIEQAQQYRNHLTDAGKNTVEYHELEGVAHALQSPEERIKGWNVIIDFLEREL